MRIILLALLFAQTIMGQYTRGFQDPKSPEVFQFEKYGNLPVLEYTGRPNVEIPLYTINHGDISIPLVVKYSSNGIRVDEEASEVGLGWYLGTGMISQIVNGKNDLVCEVEIPDFLWSPYGSEDVIAPNPNWYFSGFPVRKSSIDINRILIKPSEPSNNLDKYFAGRFSSDGGVDHEGNTLYLLYKNHFKDYRYSINDPVERKDVSVDIFQATFFGHDIKFYIDPNIGSMKSGNKEIYSDDKFKVMNNEKYRIQLIKNEYTFDYTWIITAPDGISYYFFEAKRTSTEDAYTGYFVSPDIDTKGTGYSTSDDPLFHYNLRVSSIWKIRAIKDTKGNVVTFRYEPLTTASISTANTSALELTNTRAGYQNYSIGGLGANDVKIFNPNSNVTKFPELGIKMGLRIKTGVVLNQERSILRDICFDKTNILFNTSERVDFPGSRKIDNISVFNYLNVNDSVSNRFLLKEINFKYDYFTNPSLTNNNQKRLKLLSISFGEKPYLFTYNQTPLPSKNSNSTDFWGFYNGIKNTSYANDPFRKIKNVQSLSWANSLLPLIEGKANKSAHPDFCKAGILEKIEYPTGGSTELEYELNQFDNYFFPNYDNKIGLSSKAPYSYAIDYSQKYSSGFGLRIKQTIDYDNNGNSYKKKYSYSGGKHIPAYNDDSDNSTFTSSRFPNLNPGKYDTYRVDIRSGECATGYLASHYQSSYLGNGNFVGYDKVSVEEEGANSEYNGKTVSYYTNVPDKRPRNVFASESAVSYGYPLSNYDLFGYSIRATDVDNGLLIKKEIFDKNYNKKQKEEYIYESIVVPSGKLKYNVSVAAIPEQHGYFRSTQPQGTNDLYIPELIVFTDYLIFFHPLKMTHTRLKSKYVTEFFAEDSISNKINYFYNATKEPSGKSITNQFGNNFYEENTITRSDYDAKILHNLDLPESSYVKKNGVIVESKNFSYHLNGTLLKQVDIFPKGFSDLDKKTSYFYDDYDDKGNLTDFHKNDGVSTTIFWGYDKTLPIAKIEGLRYISFPHNMITNLQTLSDFDNDSTSEDALRKALNNLRSNYPDAMITTYTYDKLVGVTSITDPKGQTSYYSYDSFGRLQNVKDADGNIITENEYHYRD